MTPLGDSGFSRVHALGGMDAWQFLLTRATDAEREFLVWEPFDGPTATWTYGEFAAESAAIAAGLQRRGVRAGDRVLIHLENCPEFLLAWFACAAVGAVAVTTNARSAVDELRYFAEHSGVVGAITQPRFAELVAAAAPGLRWIVVTGDDGAPRLGELRGSPDDLTERRPDPAAPMSIQYTSGTTARPKGVVWTHANALWGARVNSSHEHLRPDDCHLTYMPLFHTNGLAYSVLAAMWVGGRVVLMPKWSTSRFWPVSLRNRCTWVSLMGLSHRAILGMDVPEDHSYRCVGNGLVHPRICGKLGVQAIGWWGMTETVSHGIVSDPNESMRTMAIGRPAPEYGLQVVRDDGRTHVEPEETGHLLIRGVPGISMFAGYLDDDAATASSYDDEGWFRTGDLVTPHADGWISFADRAKDMLKIGAENVATSEIERVIARVRGVRESAVVGRPDPKLDEVPVAFVVVSGDPAPDLGDRVIAECRKELAAFKVPERVVVVRALPRSTVDKVDKVALRRAAASPDASIAELDAHWLTEAALDPSGDAP